VIIGAQYFLRGGANMVALGTESAHIAAIAFGLAAYALMFSAFQTLNAEGGALWILYTLPKTLPQVLREKALLWGSITLVYPLAIFGIALANARTISPDGIALALIVLIGVVIYSVLATALGVFGSNPLAQDVQQRVHPTYIYLYMLLSSLYVYAIYASTFWQRGAVMILTGALAIAMWQKARDELPFLLDPSASPPPRVSLADGLIAALIFFVLQALIGLALMIGDRAMTGWKLSIAFTVAGAITYAVMRLSYWRQKTEEVPRVFGAGVPRALALGLGGGVIATVFGLIYLHIVTKMGLMPEAHAGEGRADPTLRWWFLPLAVIAAPIFEEFIFRGLIFGGLRRFVGPIVAALASAAIFAIVHPPMSALPVFIAGLVTALVYERTRMLLAPMLVHAFYNAVLIGFQWNSLQWTQ
jgi:membrane protease YdiL (CAAX protease family)